MLYAVVVTLALAVFQAAPEKQAAAKPAAGKIVPSGVIRSVITIKTESKPNMDDLVVVVELGKQTLAADKAKILAEVKRLDNIQEARYGKDGHEHELVLIHKAISGPSDIAWPVEGIRLVLERHVAKSGEMLVFSGKFVPPAAPGAPRVVVKQN